MTAKETKKIERALHLVKLKMSYREAARKVGLHYSTVQKWAHRAGVLSPEAAKKATTKYQQRELEEYRESRLTLWQRLKRFLGV